MEVQKFLPTDTYDPADINTYNVYIIKAQRMKNILTLSRKAW